ncbi:hypothetical protein C8F04DRAFT_1294718 [Mycena alexandri]|uniref:Uncharacterized protein n=1 Tax=Mycena alexandri TaxID=1745969 RepID=A0AAD6SGR9_9AGAR|nr:hypothetical protein C8F04DRAFT_1294718 [Mycena alexandri]
MYGGNAGGSEYPSLTGAHADVRDMRRLLVKPIWVCKGRCGNSTRFGRGHAADPREYRPRRSLMAGLAAACDRQPGSRCMQRRSVPLSLCGRTMQIENGSNNQEDDVDYCECGLYASVRKTTKSEVVGLIPADGEVNKIVNNVDSVSFGNLSIWFQELRRHLIEPLPVGSSLVAVFDSSHSAGFLILPPTNDKSPPERVQEVSWLGEDADADVLARESPEPVSVCEGWTCREPGHEHETEAEMSWLGEDGDAYARARESPEPVSVCEGWTCREPGHEHDTEADEVDVISLASCQGYQLMWEYESMTRELVQILERDPHPTLRALVTNVSHAINRMTVQRHDEIRRYKRDLKRYKEWLQRRYPGVPVPRADAVDTSAPRDADLSSRSVSLSAKAKSDAFVDEPMYDLDNFQNPQFASHVPLDMERPWSM